MPDVLIAINALRLLISTVLGMVDVMLCTLDLCHVVSGTSFGAVCYLLGLIYLDHIIGLHRLALTFDPTDISD